MTASDLLHRDKPLSEWWISVCHDSRFDQVVALARAKLAESPLEREQMTGANKAIETLRTITDGDEGGAEFPTPGLIHNFTEHPSDKKED